MIKPIPNFPGYFADTEGNIWSNKLFSTLNKMKQQEQKGYLSVSLSIKNRSYKRFVHRLILETFVGPCPDGMECRHKDGTRHNNDLSNLSWNTFSTNQKDRVKHGTSNRGERCGTAKLTNLQVAEIRKLLKEKHITQKDIAKIYGVSNPIISRINTGKIWRYI
jgi:predicted XRE-type DNA-binding protein